MRNILLPAAVGIGIAIAYIDSRPTWDDMGITAGLLFLVATSFAFIASNHPWLWALAVGIWIPLASIFVTHKYGGMIAILFAFAGSYAGWYLKRLSKKV